MCAHLFRRACAHIYASCAPIYAWIFMKFFIVIVYYLMKLSFKFYKDRSFGCGDICETIHTAMCLILHFLCILQIFLFLPLKVFKYG